MWDSGFGLEKTEVPADVGLQSYYYWEVSVMKTWKYCFLSVICQGTQTRPRACHLEMSLKRRQILEQHLKGSYTDHSCGTAKGLPKEGVYWRKSFSLRSFFLVQSWRSLAEGHLSPTFANEILVGMGERQLVEFMLGLEHRRKGVDCTR